MGTVPSRPVPYPGMSVLIEHLASVEPGVASAVEDDGRALVVGGDRYALRRLNGRFVLEGEPYYGVRLVFRRRAPTSSSCARRPGRSGSVQPQR